MDKLLLRPAEAAELLGLSRSNVYELIAAGRLPAVHIGSALRIPADDLAAWIRDQRRINRKEQGNA